MDDGWVEGVEVHEKDELVVETFLGLENQTASVGWLPSARSRSLTLFGSAIAIPNVTHILIECKGTLKSIGIQFIFTENASLVTTARRMFKLGTKYSFVFGVSLVEKKS